MRKGGATALHLAGTEQGGIGGELEVVELAAATLGDGLSVSHFLVASGLVASGKEAKRLIAENGLRFNNDLVTDANATVTATTIKDELKVSIGKKKHKLVRLA